MAEPNATIVGPHAHGAGMADHANNKFVSPFLDPSLYRKPEYHVYVFSIVDPRPVDAPLIRDQPPLTKRLRIAECPPDKPYVLVTTIAHPVNQPDINPMNDQRVTYYHDGRRVAQDIVNPANLSLDQDAVLRPEQIFSQGDDYGKLGVFWSLNEIPTEEELYKARKRKEDFYRVRLNRLRVLANSDPKAMDEMVTITDHVAADYFGEEFPWHRTAKKPASCPNCGEPVKEGAAFHASAALGGVICVIDWKRTVEAGVKKLEDVPDGKRWRESAGTGGKRNAEPR